MRDGRLIEITSPPSEAHVYPAFGATLLIAFLDVRCQSAAPGAGRLHISSSSSRPAISMRSWRRCSRGETSIARCSTSTCSTRPKRSRCSVRAACPLHRMKREFTWYARDGMHVRSPVRFNGVAVGESARAAVRSATGSSANRRGRNAGREGQRAGEEARSTHRRRGPADERRRIGGAEPRFVSEAYFMDFKFEPGNYYLAGREKLEGQDVLRIEYYPTNLFNDDGRREDAAGDEEEAAERQNEEQVEQDINRKMNKTALVTLWVDPAEHQIVKYTFDNVWLDFLPGAWLVRVDDIRASMTMGQPFPGVWLPREHQHPRGVHAGHRLVRGQLRAAPSRITVRPTSRRRSKDAEAIGPRCQACRGHRVPQVRRAGARVPVRPEAVACQGARCSHASRSALASCEPDMPPEHGPFVDVRHSRSRRFARSASTATPRSPTRTVLKLAGIAVGDPVTPSAEKDIETAAEGQPPLRYGRGAEALPIARRSDRRGHGPARARAPGGRVAK